MKIDFSKLSAENEIKGEDEQETQEIIRLFENAKKYITSFAWCPEIINSYMGIGIGGVVGVFLFKFSEKINNTDDYLWVIEGDLPSAYLVVDNAPDAVTALEIYLKIMEDWAMAILKGKSTDNCFPVDAPPDKKHAKMLIKRLRLLRKEIIPNYKF